MKTTSSGCSDFSSVGFSAIERICPGYAIEPVVDLRGYQRCVDLQIKVWNYSDAADVVPMALLAITNYNGGVLLGAYDSRHAMVGFVYSILGLHNGHLVQHSHMLGVLEGHRNRNLGLALKLAQRKCALRQGVTCVVWTYDPLQSLNAHFNFNNLGTRVDTYLVNFYGRSSSVLHSGLDTDRFFACWDLDSDSVRRKVRRSLKGRADRPLVPDLPVINKVRQLDHGLQKPVGPLTDLRDKSFLFEVPADINRLKADCMPAAQAFQRQLRAVCLKYFSLGYRVTDFFTEIDPGGRRCFYFFSALPPGARLQ